MLRELFPNARIEKGGAVLDGLLADAVDYVTRPTPRMTLPLDVRGTAFQQAVWRELSRIPPGETLSYAALAARAGNPKAVRAVGSACGANPVAVLIPCHRALARGWELGGICVGVGDQAEAARAGSGRLG